MKTPEKKHPKQRIRWNLLFISLVALNGCVIDESTYEEPGPEKPYPTPSVSIWFENDCGQYGRLSSTCKSEEGNLPTPVRERQELSCRSQYGHLLLEYPWPKTLGKSCYPSICNMVPVTVQFHSTRSLSGAHSVYIEAYDNPEFMGHPIRQRVIYDYYPSYIGYEKTVSMPLPTGDHFLRAYLIEQVEKKPQRMDAFQPIKKPVMGVYGLISSPRPISVLAQNRENCPSPVQLSLNQEYMNEQQTQSRLRVALSVDTSLVSNPHSDVAIHLHESVDFSQNAKYTFRFPAEEFFVSTRMGRADFVSPSIAPGTYYVRAYIDENRNGFHDPNEPYNQFSQNEVLKSIWIEMNSTQSIDMRL